MPTIRGASDNALYYEDTGGSGHPVVLIHGWPLSGEAWKYQVAPLSRAGLRIITYDRRGFGRSDKPLTGYDYDTLADDLAAIVDGLGLEGGASLVGFSMGGGEVARYVARHGEGRLRSIVLASAVTPYMLRTGDNPDGPLTKAEAATMAASLTASSESFFDDFMTTFFSADGDLRVSEDERQEAIALCRQAAKPAALEAMAAFGATDFREDLTRITVPTLVLHGDSDAVVPFEGSGERTHRAVSHSRLALIAGAPHGVNVSHATEFNEVLTGFLR